MRISDTIRTALQSLGRRKVRTVLTSIGVFVGILTIVTMVSLGVGIQKQVTDTIKQLGLETIFVSPEVRTSPGQSNASALQHPDKPINSEAVAQLQKLDGVSSVEVILSLPSIPDMTIAVDGKTFGLTIPERPAQSRLFNPTGAPPLAGKVLENTADARGVVLTQRLLQSAGFTQSQFEGLV